MINLYCIRPKGFNVGNDIIYLGLNHFVRLAFDSMVNIISLPATSKYEAHKKAGFSAQTVYEVNQFGGGIIVGGGNLYENGELEINPTALKALEIPLMLFSLSRGKIYNKKAELVDRTDVMTDDNIAVLNNRADISLVRDKATYNHLSKMGLSPEVGGCPTLFIDEIPQHQVPISEIGRADALISIRSPELMSIPLDKQYQIRADMLNIIKQLHMRGYNSVKLLCHDHRDIPYASSFRGIEYLYTEDPYVFLSLLINTRLLITYRLHSFLPSLSLGIPAINISYDQRASSMVHTAGLEEWNINMVKDNVINEVKIRLSSLDDLALVVDKARRSVWPGLRDTMVRACSRFAKKVIL